MSKFNVASPSLRFFFLVLLLMIYKIIHAFTIPSKYSPCYHGVLLVYVIFFGENCLIKLKE